jgi:hypothetical protein
MLSVALAAIGPGGIASLVSSTRHGSTVNVFGRLAVEDNRTLAT